MATLRGLTVPFRFWGAVRFHGTEKLKRFYKNTGEKQFNVALDGRKTKTPQGKAVVLPVETLAYAVAAEWDAQLTHIDRGTMHLTSLVNSAIDMPASVVAAQSDEHLIEYLKTDTVCVRADIPEEFVVLQNEKWDPVVSWWQEKHNAPLTITTELFVPSHSPAALAAARRYLHSFTPFQRPGVAMAIETLRSFVLAAAMLDGRVDAQTATDLSRLEVIFQAMRFGEVEWAHPMDAAATMTRAAAAAFFVRTLNKA